jgi:hypothetical protein
MDLEGTPAPTPKEALQAMAGNRLDALSQARETGALPAGAAEPLLLGLIELADAMRARAERLK